MTSQASQLREPVVFPEGFRWGVAGAAHQVEGGNWNADWWEFEHQPDTICKEPSGDACDWWNRWPEDLDITAELGFDNFRFSVEWSRVEPEMGERSQATIDHYRRMCEAMRERGLEPVLTLNHFTLPRWVSRLGGWESDELPKHFGAYCQFVTEALGETVGRVCTINEPNIVATMGWLMSLFPPGKQDRAGYHRAVANLVSGHRQAVEAVRASAPGIPVGLALSMTEYQVAPGGEARRDASLASEDVFLEATEGDDFLGVQVYTRMVMGPHGWLGIQPGEKGLIMGYEYWPHALEACVRRASAVTKGRLPLLVTENGIGTTDDDERIAYVTEALLGLQRAMDDGITVLGYTYWSLLDNFEWAMGYGPRFGLVEVDRKNFQRRTKASTRWLGNVARTNRLDAQPATTVQTLTARHL